MYRFINTMGGDLGQISSVKHNVLLTMLFETGIDFGRGPKRYSNERARVILSAAKQLSAKSTRVVEL